MKAAILAGGASRRMGTPKALLLFEGEPLIARAAKVLRKAFDEIVVVSSDERFARAADAPMISDRVANRGVAAGIHAALAHFGAPTFCAACDAPFLDARFLRFLAEQSAEFDAVIPLHLGRAEPLHAVYAPSLLSFFSGELQKERPASVEAILRDAATNGAKVRWIKEDESRHFDATLRFFINWNTPEDVAAHKQSIRPSLRVGTRIRPYSFPMKEMISPDEALHLVLQNIAPMGEETVAHAGAFGRTLAQDIVSSVDLPPFRNSAMDGYAVRARDLELASLENPVVLPVIETVAAGQVPTSKLNPNQCARVMTGAALPDGCDAVVMREETEERGHETVFSTSPRGGENVRPQGDDIAQGETALRRGTLVRAAQWGMLASLEQNEIAVVRRPRLALVVTGDEVVAAGTELQAGQIRDSNSYTLRALARDCGAVVEVFRMKDDAAALREIFAQPGFDGFITSGGISAGDFDIVRDVLLEDGEIVFYRVAMKPGKPVMFARIAAVPVWALPGNPVSVMVAFELFVRPALLQMQGRTARHRVCVEAQLQSDLRSVGGKVEWVRARVVPGVRSNSGAPDPQAGAPAAELKAEGRILWKAEIAGAQGSGRLSTMVNANALLEIGADVTQLKAGDFVKARLLDCEEIEA